MIDVDCEAMKHVGAKQAVDVGELRHHIVEADVESLDFEVPDDERSRSNEGYGYAVAGGDGDPPVGAHRPELVEPRLDAALREQDGPGDGGEPRPQLYHDLWVVTLDAGGRCTRFEEWPFWPPGSAGTMAGGAPA